MTALPNRSTCGPRDPPNGNPNKESHMPRSSILKLCALGALALVACTDRVVVAPNAPFPLPPQLSADATKFWETSATVRWNEIARAQTRGRQFRG